MPLTHCVSICIFFIVTVTQKTRFIRHQYLPVCQLSSKYDHLLELEVPDAITAAKTRHITCNFSMFRILKTTEKKAQLRAQNVSSKFKLFEDWTRDKLWFFNFPGRRLSPSVSAGAMVRRSVA